MLIFLILSLSKDEENRAGFPFLQDSPQGRRPAVAGWGEPTDTDRSNYAPARGACGEDRSLRLFAPGKSCNIRGVGGIPDRLAHAPRAPFFAIRK